MKKGREKAIYVADSVLSKVYDAVGFSKTLKSPTNKKNT